MKLFFHAFLSLSLLLIGEYTTSIVMQIIFLVTIIHERLYQFFYLPIILFLLMKLFASTLYGLYFINLCIFIYSLYKMEIYFYVQSYFLFIFNGGVLATLYILLDEMRYEFYLWSNIDDVVNSIDIKVIALLTSLHLIILLIMGYNKEKLLRKY